MKQKVKKWVFAKLQASKDVVALVGDRLFQARTGAEQQAPLLVFSSFGMRYAHCKDCSFVEGMTFAVECIATDADTADALALAVKNTLNECYIANIGDVFVQEEREEYVCEQETFVVSLFFNVEL